MRRDLLAAAQNGRVAAAHLAVLGRVHLVEIGGAGSGLSHPDGDGEHRLGNRQDLGRRTWALGDEDEAGEIGTRLDGSRHVLLARQPADLDERA